MSVIERAIKKYTYLCDSNNIDASHGREHVLSVLKHINCAIDSYILELSSDTMLSLRLAALLHDADDHKYFTSSICHTNARRIMNDLDISSSIVDKTIEMISYVSTSQNGDNIPIHCYEYPELLWVRWADRIEACGVKGILRCWEYNVYKNLPLSCQTTPKPKTRQDVMRLASKERFINYKGSSASMIDHYYDKLLHITQSPPPNIIKNNYLQQQYKNLSDPMIELCLIFSNKGDETVVDHIHKLQVYNYDQHKSEDHKTSAF